MKQREAVFTAVCDVTGESTFESAIELTKEDRESVHSNVFDVFKAGDVDFKDAAKEKYNTDSLLNGYISGLISNWLRKDSRLNGNTKYVPKNPGSRAGQGDSMIRELRKLLKIHTGKPKQKEIESYIATRLTEIQATKAKAVSIDYSQLPPELQDLAPTETVEDEDAA